MNFTGPGVRSEIHSRLPQPYWPAEMFRRRCQNRGRWPYGSPPADAPPGPTVGTSRQGRRDMGTPLKPKTSPLDKNGRHLSVVVYWHPRNKPDALANGHAALIIDADRWLDAPKDDQTGELPPYYYNVAWYVSWVGGK